MSAQELTLFHAKNTRSTGVLYLLEELGASYQLHPIDLRAGEARKPEYLKINPMGKVPAIRHNGAVVTEQVAIYLYLADLFPKASMAPPIGDPLRGPYLRWMAFYGSCFEPAILDRAMKLPQGDPKMSPYGSFDAVFAVLLGQLKTGPWMLGEKYTALDVLYGVALTWMTMAKLIPETDTVKEYIKRTNARPGVVRARELDT